MEGDTVCLIKKFITRINNKFYAAETWLENNANQIAIIAGVIISVIACVSIIGFCFGCPR